MQRNPNQKRRILPSVAIVGDGFCEKLYFEQLKQFESIQHLRIFPELPDQSGKGGGFMRVFKKAGTLKDNGHDAVFCLIDMDVVYGQGKYESYQKERVKLERRGITIIECNPCFEIWVLLHFQRTTALMDDCAEVAQKIKENSELSDYSKEQKYYIRKKIYEKLRNRLETNAILNAKWLEAQQNKDQSRYFPRCEMYKLIAQLLSIQ